MPGPPPGAGAPIGSFALVVLVLANVFGFDASDLAPPIGCRNERGLGEAAAVAGDALVVAPLGDASFVAECFAFLAGEAAGLSAGEALSPALGDASFFAERFAFLAGEALGLSAAAGLSAGDGL